MATFFNRLTGAALMDARAYEEVEADRSATLQSMLVVLLSSLAAGVGALGPVGARPLALAGISLVAFAMWFMWSVLTLQIGTRIMPGSQTRADVGQLLRTTGFAAAPGILRIAAVIPGLAGSVYLITTAWMLMAMIVAVRQALDLTSTVRAFAVCALGLVLTLGFAIAIGLVFSPTLH